MPEPNCVEMLLDEIDRALKAELYVVATMAALTLPDMCAALETEGFWAKNVNYVAWCEKNLPQEFFLIGDARTDEAASQRSPSYGDCG